MENSRFYDVSQVSKKNKIVMLLVALLFLVFLIINILRYVKLNAFEPVVIFLDVMFLFVIFQRSHPTYITEVDKRGFRITKKSLFGKKVYDVPYREIAGIYKYKSSLAHPINFRRSLTLNSALDGRVVWVLAYRTHNKKGKIENRRFFFKTNEEMLDELSERMPNRVRVKEEEVAIAIIRKEAEGK
ncbi:MAG: hypothetical protein ACRC8T_04780 [Acidaminococcaceae bacterium]